MTESQNGNKADNGYWQKLGVAVIVICTLMNSADILLNRFGNFASGYSTFGQEFQDFQKTVTVQLQSLQESVAALPVEGVTIVNMQDHLHAIDGRLDALSTRESTIEGETIRTRADLDNIVRSSAVPLTPEHARGR